MLKLPKLSPEEYARFQNGVIQVYGKAANRTVLGIVDAFLTLYPNITYEDLKKAIPDELNPTSHPAPKTIFRPHTDRPVGFVHRYDEVYEEFKKAGLEQNFNAVFFTQPDEIFTLKNGEKIVVVKMIDLKADNQTGLSDLQTLANHVKQYGIVVEEFSEAEAFKKGSYRLKYIDKVLFEKIRYYNLQSIEPEVLIQEKVVEKIVEVPVEKVVEKVVEVPNERIVEKKHIPFWVWIIVGLAGLIPIILWLAGVFNPKTIEKEKEIIKVDTVVKIDTVYIYQVKDIERRFNDVQFEKAKYDIPTSGKVILDELVEFLKQNPTLKLLVLGHASIEGDPDFNFWLSEQRAKAVVEYLISKGIDSSLLSYEGRGTKNPKDVSNLSVNRRVEFILKK